MFARWSLVLACLLAPWSLSTRTSTPRASVADPEGMYFHGRGARNSVELAFALLSTGRNILHVRAFSRVL